MILPLILAVQTVAALPSSWTEFQYDASNNAVFDSPSWDVAWRADIGARSNGGISVVGKTVYIESFNHCIYAFDALTGKERWHQNLPNVVMNTPLVTSGIVIVGTGNAKMLLDSPTMWMMGRPEGDAVYGLDAQTGQIRWRFDTVGENMPTGALVQEQDGWRFVFTNGDDHIYALDALTGKLLWKQPALGVDGMASLTVVDGNIYGESTLGDAGYLALKRSHSPQAQAWSHTWAIDPQRGQYVWSAPFGVADASVTGDRARIYAEGFDLANAPETSPDQWATFLNTKAQLRTIVTALDRANGEPIWKYVSDAGRNNTFGSAAFTSDTLLHDGVLYAPLAFASEFVALDADKGTPKWLIHTRFPVKTSPVLKDGYLFFGDGAANLYVVSASNGNVVHLFSFPGPPEKYGFSKSAPVIVGNTLFISADRWLYALRVSDLEKGAVSPQAAPPALGPSRDWCVFDPPCDAATGVIISDQ